MKSSTNKLAFDHVTIVARSLEEGTSYVGEKLGIDMPYGGKHPRMGTHNQLLALGPDCFLEVVAIDPDAKDPPQPRWFGLDEFDSEPRVAAWVLGTTEIHTVDDEVSGIIGPAIKMARGELSWLMTIREDGKLPMSGAFPKLLQWPKGSHVATNMEDRNCRLFSLSISHPQADCIAAWLDGKFHDPRVDVRTGATALKVKINTPSGLKSLG